MVLITKPESSCTPGAQSQPLKCITLCAPVQHRTSLQNDPVITRLPRRALWTYCPSCWAWKMDLPCPSLVGVGFCIFPGGTHHTPKDGPMRHQPHPPLHPPLGDLRGPEEGLLPLMVSHRPSLQTLGKYTVCMGRGKWGAVEGTQDHQAQLGFGG